ncbi:MAG: hypothetical protein GXO31_00105 [Epsilonproteobacteria bacterium]|nr:hypothetical protein [Campylobacterota bacterium]
MNIDSFIKTIGKESKPSLDIKIEIDFEIFEDKEKAFLHSLKNVAVEGVVVKKAKIEEKIKELSKDYKNIASIYPFSIRTLNSNDIKDPKELNNVDLSIVKGKFGVCENGAVWIEEEENIHRAIYSICKHLLILLDRDSLVSTMHEAYERIDPSLSYGIFISGPSKTADIEQSLVIGAHGAKFVTVFLIDE